MKLTDRISLLEFCNREFPNGTAIEIGVASGCFTKQILATWKSLKTLHAIDAWKHFPNGYSDDCNLSQQVQDERYERVLLDFKDEPRIKIIRDMSLHASANFENWSADFIYLDANHSTDEVYADIVNWWSILKPGGIFAGHDYVSGNGKGYGVKAAVDRWAAEMSIKIFTTKKEYCRPEGVYGAGWEGCSFILRK